MAVAHRLAHDHDVRHDALFLEGPEMRAESAVTGLHLFGDAASPGGADVAIHPREVTRRRQDLSAHARARLGDERRRGDAFALKPLDDVAHGESVALAGSGVVPLVDAAIDVR